MAEINLLDDALIRVLREVDPDTGQTNWDKMVSVCRKKAASGDAKWVKLLKEVEAIETRRGQSRQVVP